MLVISAILISTALLIAALIEAASAQIQIDRLEANFERMRQEALKAKFDKLNDHLDAVIEG